MRTVPQRGTRYGPRRYVARPALRAVIAKQGRTQAFLARALGVSGPQMNLIVSGRRTIAEDDARSLVTILGVAFGVLFEFPTGTVATPKGRQYRISEGGR